MSGAEVGGEPGDMPVPGGLGAGVIYNTGRLQARSSSYLYTKMTVYPNGIGTLSNWFYTTATNRTEKGVEVVGMYNTSPGGSIGVFDWSCMPGYPCSNGATSPSWIWTKPFSQISCNITWENDGGGHTHQGMYYVNGTALQPNGTWQNLVWFWNYCTGAWDLVYSHTFGGTQKDCSLDNSCGWWGPILETFMSDPQPAIREIAFYEGWLYHDGIWSSMGTDDTSWSPPTSTWTVFHRTPNRAWGAGNSL